MMRPLLARAFLLAGLAGLAACAGDDAAGFDRSMASYVGQPEIRLVEGLGVPQQVYQASGQRFLEYRFDSAPPASSGLSFGLGAGSFSSGYGRGSGFGTGIGIGLPLGGSGYDATPCTVTFEIRDDRVLNFRRDGNNCR